MKRSHCMTSALLALSLCASPSIADPLKNMGEVGDAIRTCWKAPADPKGASVTLSFSLRRDGSLIGQPRPTSIDVPGNDEEKRKFVDAAVAALRDCTPLEFAPDFAEGVGGQVFTMQFAAPNG
ncbi:hypothetical protein [Aquamicrobium sp. LC103]|uniref:hypothetical protein n=1 Tax=Aquamicrobium sp. LC103 TaxID=1120658 RepID=UPI00069B48A2|nr:hypothetical protein [Aquamicrobium sp. LC103]TKT74706.1 hypothetical protein XW59_022520 [Aquamicrobium sp. LC103]